MGLERLHLAPPRLNLAHGQPRRPIYNWWNLYLRFYDEEHHREAIRTRPMLMAGVGRQIQSGGRRTVNVSVLHEKGDLIAQAVSRISNELHHIRAVSAQQNTSRIFARGLAAMASMQPGSR